MNHEYRRNHLICKFMRQSPYVTAKEAQKLADATLGKKKKKSKKQRKNRNHPPPNAKKHDWKKTYPPKEFSDFLREAGFLDYNAYLESKHWTRLRSETLADHGFCEKCKSTQYLRLHHCNYSRLGHERPTDIIVLCDYHHTYLHEKLNTAYKHLTLAQKVLHSREILHLRHPGSRQQTRLRLA